MHKIIFPHLNINSIRSKFDQLSDMIRTHIAVLMTSESKLDNSFSDGKFLIEGYRASFRLDWNKLGGGVMLSVRSDIPTKLIYFDIGFESFFFELNFRRKKWLLIFSHNHKRSYVESHLNCLSKCMDVHSSNKTT